MIHIDLQHVRESRFFTRFRTIPMRKLVPWGFFIVAIVAGLYLWLKLLNVEQAPPSAGQPPPGSDAPVVEALPKLETEALLDPHFLELEKVSRGCWEKGAPPCPPLGRENPFAPPQ